MNQHLNSIMIGITATMLLALAFSITDAHSFNNKKNDSPG